MHDELNKFWRVMLERCYNGPAAFAVLRATGSVKSIPGTFFCRIGV